MDNQPEDSQAVDRLAQEFLEQYRRGEAPQISDYVENHPQYAEQIRDLFPTLEMMETIAPGKHSGDVDRLNADVGEPSLESLGDYRILREVGRGGMGVVYEAEQVSLSRRVALKVLNRRTLLDPRQKLRFQREAKAAAKLHHTNIVPVFGVGTHDGSDYYVMQFIPGLGLDEVLDELRRFDKEGALPAGLASAKVSIDTVNPAPASRIVKTLVDGSFGTRVESNLEQHPTQVREIPAIPITLTSRDRDHASSSSAVLPGQSSASKTRSNYWQSVARIGVQVGEALQYAHRQGVIHRDIKPGNLLLDSNGTVWISDFGLAKADDQQDLTHTGDVLGTLRYMAPEMFSGKAEARSDIYALGLTLYELLTLRPAYSESDRHELIRKVTSETPTPLRKLSPSIPRDLETITNKAIAPDPADRYQSAGELAEDLQRYLDDEPIAARRITGLGRTWRWCKRRPTVASLSGILLALLVMLAVGGPLIALQQGSLAEQARMQANRADQARTEATDSREQTRRYLYVAHMNMVEQAWQVADLARAGRLLDRYVPNPDEEDLRGFEWFYWRRLLSSHHLPDPLLHDDIVWCVAFSPNGKLLASASADATVKVWDVAGSKAVHVLTGHSAAVRYVAFSPNGQKLATASFDKTVKLWDVASGTVVRTIQTHTSAVNCLDFSPTGDQLASTGDDALLISDTTTGAAAHRINLKSPVDCLAFSPDGALIATANRNTTVELWDATTGESKAILSGHQGKVLSVAFSHDGSALASAGAGPEIKVWDTISHQETFSLRGHKFFVMSVAFSPDGSTLATASTDNTVKLWDLDRGLERTTLKGHNYLVNSVAFSPDGRLLASASHDKTVKLWDVDSGNLTYDTLQGHRSRVWSVDFTKDGTALVSGGEDGTVRLWDVATGEELTTPGRHQHGVCSVALSTDGKRLASSDRGGFVKVWDVANRKEELSLREPIGKWRSAELEPVGNTLAFSPDGKSLASGAGNGTVRLWDTTNWKPTKTWQAHATDVLSVAFAPDGKSLATGGREDGVKLWDLESDKERWTRSSAVRVYAVAFSPDGQLVASSHAQANDETIRLWDVADGTEQLSLKGHTWVVNSLAFSPDGKSLASASWDFTIKLWNVPTGEVTSTLNQAIHARCVAFSADGKTLASGGTGTIKLWHGAPDFR